MTYCLDNLAACSRLRGRPNYIPKARLRGAKAAGITYEKKVGKVLNTLFPIVRSGEWFEYHDKRRSGVCCIDHYVLCKEHIILVECKLSETELAWRQMSELYAPILEHHFGLPVARVQAARFLRSGRLLVDHPKDVAPGRAALWHVLV